MPALIQDINPPISLSLSLRKNLSLSLPDMVEALRFQPTHTCVNQPKLLDLSRGFRNSFFQVRILASSDVKPLCLRRKAASYSERIRSKRGKYSGLSAWTQEGPLQELEESPVSVELKPICSESQFDQVISQGQLADEAAIVVWVASWCRKCVYLKPKLEKLAADYYPRLWFYCVDVNKVPHKLVARAEVTKMPTIQLWKNGSKQGEVIGGHKAYLVVNEIRDMIENESTT